MNTSNNRIPLLLHVLAWVIILILPFYVTAFDSELDLNFFFRIYSRTIIYIALFYLNFFWLIPKFLLKNRKFVYYISAIALAISFYIVFESIQEQIFDKKYEMPKKEFSNQLPPPNDFDKRPLKFHKGPPFGFDVFNFLVMAFMVTGFAIGLSYSQKFNQNEKERKELEKERLDSELAFLKNQISPHFFFNTLNNIYALIQINSDDAQKSVLKLSKLMRYLLYESEKGDTKLSREIEFMQNYIDLMLLRINNNKVNINVSFPENFSDKEIQPLLFISFIENAFKHGISYRDKSFVNIEMSLIDNKIIFKANNSIGKTSGESTESGSGIGLENIKKRLALLYPDKHNLSISETNQEYSVVLELYL